MSRQMTKLMPWVGGKAQLMRAIQMLLPTHYKTLVDVFGGSGILREHFVGGARTMNANNRTIAFQVPEELFDRLKDYLARNGLKQKDFILGLIERELNDAGNEE